VTESTERLTDTLSNQVKGVITSALRAKYVSVSSHMNYPTGNAYQTLSLGEDVVGGYREDRSKLFGLFNFTGRHVLDCGCNLGELSRLARERGAMLVDGIEYDDYFVQIARLINAYKATTRVSFSQGDLTDSATIKDTYDVTMAFSVFPYILPVLEKIGAVTSEALVLETHNITSDIPKVYIKPVSQFFPHHTFVDYTDFGHGEGKRAVLVFAKRLSTLVDGGLLRSTVDIEKSEFGFLDSILSLAREIVPGRPYARADLERFVSVTPSDAGDIGKLTAGRGYWIEMIKGYLQARREGGVTMENSYVRFLRRMLTELNFDPTLTEQLSSDESIIQRVTYRFKDVDLLADGEKAIGKVSPIHVLSPKEAGGKMKIVHGETGNPVFVDVIDGYHRVFWASLFGIRKLAALYTYQ